MDTCTIDANHSAALHRQAQADGADPTEQIPENWNSGPGSALIWIPGLPSDVLQC